MLLALLFLFTSGTKITLPFDVLASMGSLNQIALLGLFVRFIGVAEMLGALSLILLGLLSVCLGFVPLAATRLVIIMISATVLTLAADGVATAIVSLAVGRLRCSSLTAGGDW